LGVAANTCNKIYLKACNDAGNTDFNDLLDTLGTKSDRPGRPPKIQNGSKISADIRADMMRFNIYKLQDAGLGAAAAYGIHHLGRR
jgi:hypothetical protein